MRSRWQTLLAAATILAGIIAMYPTTAEAHGFHGRIIVGGFYGGPFGPWAYYGPAPYWYAPTWARGGFNPTMAAAADLGAVDLNVKPGSAQVWVDGRFVAEARDLDGSPNLLWLREGPHHLVIYEGGYRSYEDDIAVQLGQKTDLKVHLDKGNSPPPGMRPSEKG